MNCTFGLLKEIWTKELASFSFVDVYYTLLQQTRKFSFLPTNFVSNELFSGKKISKVTCDFKEKYPQFYSDFCSHGLFLIPFVFPPANAAKSFEPKWNLIVLNRNSDIYRSPTASHVLHMHFFNGCDDSTTPFRASQRKLMR